MKVKDIDNSSEICVLTSVVYVVMLITNGSTSRLSHVLLVQIHAETEISKDT